MKVSDMYKVSSLDDPKAVEFHRKRNYPLRIYETSLRNGKVVRLMASDQYQAKEKLEEAYGKEEVISVLKMI